jgi:hypothetical protein
MEESKEQQVEEETRDYEHEHHGRDRVKGTRISSISPERALSSNNHSGVRGVCYNHSKKMWHAEIGFRGKKIDLGAFKDKKAAIQARKEAEEKYYKPILMDAPKKETIRHLPYSSIIDWTGKKFPHFQVIQCAGRFRTAIKWLCHCECGNDFLLTSTELRQGRITSCGCRKERKKYAYHTNNLGTARLVEGSDVVKFLSSKPNKGNKTSGVKGVYQATRGHGWYAKLTFKGKEYHVLCHSKKAAIRAREALEEKYIHPFLEKHEDLVKQIKENRKLEARRFKKKKEKKEKPLLQERD